MAETSKRLYELMSMGEGIKMPCPYGLLAQAYERIEHLEARMAELVDAPDSKSGSFGSAGSSPAPGTKIGYEVTSPQGTERFEWDGTDWEGKTAYEAAQRRFESVSSQKWCKSCAGTTRFYRISRSIVNEVTLDATGDGAGW